MSGSNNSSMPPEPETELQEVVPFSKEPESEQVTPVTSKKKSTFRKTHRAGSYTMQEDKLLISAWLNTSLNAVVGTDQQMKAFWSRVHRYYEQYKDFESSRSANSLMHRWSSINCAVRKFCSAYEKTEARHPSGMNEQNKIQVAKELYCSLENITAFQHEHCWNELRFQPKWLSAVQERDQQQQRRVAKKGASTTSPASSSPFTPDPIVGSDSSSTELRRTAGRDAEKEQPKHAGKATTDETKRPLYEIYENTIKNSENHRALKIDLFSKIYEQGQAQIAAEEARERVRMDAVEARKRTRITSEETLERERLRVEMAKVELEAKKFLVQQQKEEERIMLMDLTTLAPDTAEYFKRRRAEILGKSFRSS